MLPRVPWKQIFFTEDFGLACSWALEKSSSAVAAPQLFACNSLLEVKPNLNLASRGLVGLLLHARDAARDGCGEGTCQEVLNLMARCALEFMM